MSSMAALITLTIGAFAIGMAEFVIMGLLPDIARTYEVTVSRAGMLISGYAIGVAVGGPVIAAFTSRFPRKLLLCVLMLVFVAGNVLAIVSPTFTILMVARIVSSLAHGTFLGAAALIAASLAAPDKRASAIAMIMTGMTVANIAGVPFGTFIGQHYGWEMTFAVIAALGLLTFAGIAFLVPDARTSKSASVRSELLAMAKPQVLLALGVILFGFGGLFATFTYIAPILTDLSGFREQNVILILIVFGIGVTLGNIFGGKLADRHPARSLALCLALLVPLLLALDAALPYRTPAVIGIFLWGFMSYSLVPAMQVRVLEAARDAEGMAATVIHSAFNIGNAAGAALGGLIIAGAGLRHLPLASAAVTFVGLALALISMRKRRSSTGALTDAQSAA